MHIRYLDLHSYFMKYSILTLLVCVMLAQQTGFAQRGAANEAAVNAAADRLENKTIIWRRDIHQNPELGNREFRTAKLVAAHLRSLGMEVKEAVAHTGVVGI